MSESEAGPPLCSWFLQHRRPGKVPQGGRMEMVIDRRMPGRMLPSPVKDAGRAGFSVSWCPVAPSSMNPRSGHAQGGRAEMVIDGRTLGRVLGSPGEDALAELAALCGGVVVCRASPAQKAAIVRMMARHKQQRLHVRPPPQHRISSRVYDI